jgi:hypothetical protein
LVHLQGRRGRSLVLPVMDGQYFGARARPSRIIEIWIDADSEGDAGMTLPDWTIWSAACRKLF